MNIPHATGSIAASRDESSFSRVQDHRSHCLTMMGAKFVDFASSEEIPEANDSTFGAGNDLFEFFDE